MADLFDKVPLPLQPQILLVRELVLRYQLPQSVASRRYRAGIIPFSEDQFIIGVDRRSGDLTDFGGGYSTHIDRLSIIAAKREFQEESYYVIYPPMNDLLECWCVANCNSLIIFYYMPYPDFQFAFSQIRERCHSNPNSEMRNILTINFTDLKSSMDSGEVYSRVSELLYPIYSELVNKLSIRLTSYESFKCSITPDDTSRFDLATDLPSLSLLIEQEIRVVKSCLSNDNYVITSPPVSIDWPNFKSYRSYPLAVNTSTRLPKIFNNNKRRRKTSSKIAPANSVNRQ